MSVNPNLKKTLIKISILLLFLIILFSIIGIEQKKKFDEFYRKIELIKKGMGMNEVIHILGEPVGEDWIDSEISEFNDKTKKKYKKLLILTFCPKVYWSYDCSFGIKVFFDKKGGHVVAIGRFMT